MSSVVVDVEANEVALKDTQENLVSDWENTEDLTAWERRVQKEPKLGIPLGRTDFLAQHGR